MCWDSQILYKSAYIWSQQLRLQKQINHFGNSQTNSITWSLTPPWIINWILVSQQATSHRLPVYTVCAHLQFSGRCMQSTVNVWTKRTVISKSSFCPTYKFMQWMRETQTVVWRVSLPFQIQFICCLGNGEKMGACKSAFRWYNPHVYLSTDLIEF